MKVKCITIKDMKGEVLLDIYDKNIVVVASDGFMEVSYDSSGERFIAVIPFNNISFAKMY